jgi:hypothetical protein
MMAKFNLNDTAHCFVCNKKADWLVVRSDWLFGTHIYNVCHKHKRLIEQYGYWKVRKECA